MSIAYRIVVLTLFLLVYFIGLIGNGLLIFIVFRQKNLRTVPNLLVVSLALGDFFFVLFCVPFGAVAYAMEYYPFPTSYCRFENFIINLSLGVSVFSLLALSADRYKIIVTPFSSHASDPSIKLKIVFIMIWVLSTMLALPETFYSGLIKETLVQANNQTVQLIYCWSPNDGELLFNGKFMITRQILRLIVYYLMPLVCVSIFYTLIAKHLFQAKSVIYNPANTQTLLNSSSDETKRRSMKIPFVNMNGEKKNLTERPSFKTLLDDDVQKETGKQNNNDSDSPLLPMNSSTLNNEDTPNENHPLSNKEITMTSSISFINNSKTTRELFGKNASIRTKNRIAMQTLYQNAKTRKQLKARRKVAKTVLFLCSVFFICWLPKQIHDLYWFVGVIVYSARWNHFWQFNKTLALILSYVYSCINPFALYFLSSTFRHFYNRYIFFWKSDSCFCLPKSIDHSMHRPRFGDTVTFSEGIRRSSANNISMTATELNRYRISSHLTLQTRTSNNVLAHRISAEPEVRTNGQLYH